MSAHKIPTRTVLIVEDDAHVREMMTKRFEQAGFGVLACGEADAASAFLAKERVDLVCLDLGLPIASGFALCERVRADPRTRDLPILVVTARTGLEDQARAIEVGANDLLAKPFRMQELMARAQALVEERARKGAAKGL